VTRTQKGELHRETKARRATTQSSRQFEEGGRLLGEHLGGGQIAKESRGDSPADHNPETGLVLAHSLLGLALTGRADFQNLCRCHALGIGQVALGHESAAKRDGEGNPENPAQGADGK